jgi:hypothetical protein
MIFPGVDGFVGMGWERFFARMRGYAQGRIGCLSAMMEEMQR